MFEMILGDCHKCDGNDTVRPDPGLCRRLLYRLVFRLPLVCRNCNARFSVFRVPEFLSRMYFYLFH